MQMSSRSGNSSGPNAAIGDGIQLLSKSNAKLERMLAKIGTPSDTPDFRSKMHQEQTDSTLQVKSLMTSLKQLTSESSKSGNNSVLQRLTGQFDKEFQRFQKVNTQMESKQIKVIDAVRKQSANSLSSSQSNSSHLADSSTRGGTNYDEADPIMSRGSGTRYEGNQQQQATRSDEPQLEFIAYDISELEQRSSEIIQIEQDVLEVSEMYKDLQTMVHEQQGNIDSIDGSITTAMIDTGKANVELMEAEEYQQKARKRKCCLMFIILGVLAVIVLVIVIMK